jgi:hypothetical protein
MMAVFTILTLIMARQIINDIVEMGDDYGYWSILKINYVVNGRIKTTMMQVINKLIKCDGY